MGGLLQFPSPGVAHSWKVSTRSPLGGHSRPWRQDPGPESPRLRLDHRIHAPATESPAGTPHIAFPVVMARAEKNATRVTVPTSIGSPHDSLISASLLPAPTPRCRRDDGCDRHYPDSDRDRVDASDLLPARPQSHAMTAPTSSTEAAPIAFSAMHPLRRGRGESGSSNGDCRSSAEDPALLATGFSFQLCLGG